MFCMDRKWISNESLVPHKVIVREADEFGGVLTSPYFLTIMDLFPVSVFTHSIGLRCVGWSMDLSIERAVEISVSVVVSLGDGD